MVPYYKDKQPGIAQWTGNMDATVVIDQTGNVSFTNLDEISGRVLLRSGKSADIDSVVVKLEGESRTRLMSLGDRMNNDRPRPQLEYHKILYKVQTVFPPADVLEGRSHMSSRAVYTIPAGQHEYPFKFKLPFNNMCHYDKNQLPTMSMSGVGFEIAKPPTRHVKRTLPPTLTGFPGEAEIRYYIKVTVSRHSIFKENPRAYTPFNFFPIEPPRPPTTGSEIFARQKHSFSAVTDHEPTKAKLKGILGMKKDSTFTDTDSKPPCVSVDARLPEPAILTCNQEIPLRLIVKKLNDYSDAVYLQSLQISLIGSTMIRAHDVYRTETSSWFIMSKSNLGIRIGSPSDPIDSETVLDDRLWRSQALPNTIAPSFETCNISRSYQLDVKVGLNYTGNTDSASKPQSIILPFRLNTSVFSGIAPPAKLLEAMAASRERISKSSAADPASEKLRMETRTSKFGATQVPPASATSGPSNAPEIPPRPEAGTGQVLPTYADAPPSYEDAIASDLQPVDAPRPDYAPPPPAEDDVLRGDEKR